MTEYTEIFDRFKDNITDPDLLQFSSSLQEEMLTALMNKAITRCKRICKDEVDLSQKNDLVSSFKIDIPDDVIDIITEWMTVFWLTPYLNNVENLRNALSTKDFSFFSPANLLGKISETHELARKRARSLTNEYSYIHADMSRLKS